MENIAVVAVASGIALGCATHRSPDSEFVCGGSLTVEETAQRQLAATTTEYSWARAWVEQHSAPVAVPTSQRLFLLRETRPRTAWILEYREGVTLAEVLRQAGVVAGQVRVLRQIAPAKDQRIDTTNFTVKIQPLDVVSFGGTVK